MHVFANVLAQITMIRKSNDSAMRSRIFKKLLLFICAFKYKKGGGLMRFLQDWSKKFERGGKKRSKRRFSVSSFLIFLENGEIVAFGTLWTFLFLIDCLWRERNPI